MARKNTIQRPENCRSIRSVGVNGLSDGENIVRPLQARAASIELKLSEILLASLGVCYAIGGAILDDDEVLEHERVHLRSHEAAIGVFRSADDGFAANVEARVDEHRASGQVKKRRHHSMELGISLPIDCLHSCTVINVGHGRNV